MDNAFSYVIAAVAILAVVGILLAIFGKRGKSGGKSKLGLNRTKNSAQIIRDATKRLEKNPHDPEALTQLGNVYYTSQVWDKAYPIYEQLVRLAGTGSNIDAFHVPLRCGICALNLDKLPEALSALGIAYKKDPHDYEVNYYVGQAFFKDKQYDKAVPCLKKALLANPEAEGIYLLLGQSYYHGHHYRDCLPCFKRALTEDPSNKEALYDMADAMTQEGHGDKAIKVFMHLRADPVYGAKSCLEAGLYHTSIGDFTTAMQDFEIGLRHENTPTDILLELQYRYAQCYFSQNQFGKGLALLNQIRSLNSSYKDVNALYNRYQELSQNTNLQVYLSSGSSDFVSLCRKFLNVMYKQAQVKILDIQVAPSFTDILAEVDSAKFEDVELFRFFRTTGSAGELYVRDFHGHMHDVKADRGYCICAGTFSEEAHKYTEGRPLDLIEKTQLSKILKQIS